jgi:branched-chain amino acid transport system ATP-binding protein
MSLLEVDGLAVARGAGLALRDCGFRLEAGRALAVLGANGAGKSTLMQAIIGLLRVRAGTIRLRGQTIHALRPARRARLGIGYCPEGRRVFPGLTVQENLEVACWADATERRRRIGQAYELFPALAALAPRAAWQLSGGQQQMLAIGRSLMNAPALLLLDEPSLGLAPALAHAVLSRIPDITGSGVAVLLAEQNAALALRVCDDALLLRNGHIVEAGLAASLAESDAVRRAFLGP